MSTNKSLNYLDNHNTHPATAGEDLDAENFFIDAIFHTPNELKNSIQQINAIPEEINGKWSVTFKIKGTNICYKIDSGAQVNVIRANQITTLQKKTTTKKKRNKQTKKKSTTTLRAYNGSSIPVKGQCTLDIQHRGKNVHLLFIVTYTNSALTIELNSSKQLNLIKRKLSISNSQKRNLLNKYEDCFGKIGTLPKVHHIAIYQNITPVVTPTSSSNSLAR